MNGVSLFLAGREIVPEPSAHCYYLAAGFLGLLYTTEEDSKNNVGKIFM